MVMLGKSSEINEINHTWTFEWIIVSMVSSGFSHPNLKLGVLQKAVLLYNSDTYQLFVSQMVAATWTLREMSARLISGGLLG